MAGSIEADSRRVSPDDVAPLQAVSLLLARRLRKRSAIELTLSQVSALSNLERHGSLRIGDLARHEQIGKSSVTRLVARLEELGYLRREVDPDDGRGFVVTITTRGDELLKAARERANEFLAEEVQSLPEPDRQAVLDAIPALQRLVGLAD